MGPGPIPATRRLHYEDSRLLRFEARVLGARAVEGGADLALDRTAFYVESGGQPSDRGVLAGCEVVGLSLEDGVVWHRIACAQVPAEGAPVTGEVDAAVRQDHMQQHTGQHILSQAFVRAGDRPTRGFHLGLEESTIDLGGDRPDEALVEAAATEANRCVFADLPVRVHAVDRADIGSIPLRREPVAEVDVLRVIEIEGFDWSACGGTHAQGTGEVGPVHVLAVEKSKALWRVRFLAGWRTVRYLARAHRELETVAREHSVRWDGVAEAARQWNRRATDLARDLKRLQVERGEREAERLRCERGAAGTEAPRFAHWCGEASVEEVRALVARLLELGPGVVLAGGTEGERTHWMAGRAGEVSWSAGRFLRDWLTSIGGKGGGTDLFAQGSAPVPSVEELAAIRKRMDDWERGLA